MLFRSRPTARHLRFFNPSSLTTSQVQIPRERIAPGAPPGRAASEAFAPSSQALLVTYCTNAPEAAGTLFVLDKPIITIFNKMDVYEKQTFDPWLEEEVRAELLNELKDKWLHETQGNAVFISATEKINVEELRTSILTAVRKAYQIRYPYRSEFFG